MVRRNDSTGELAYYWCWAPHRVPLSTLVRVAGRHWTIEESFRAAKGQAGLDEHQVRTWTSWRRWVILSMLAMAFLAVTAVNERDGTPTPRNLIRFTLNESRRLFDRIILARTATQNTIWAWSLWCRKHQATARTYHHCIAPAPGCPDTDRLTTNGGRRLRRPIALPRRFFGSGFLFRCR